MRLSQRFPLLLVLAVATFLLGGAPSPAGPPPFVSTAQAFGPDCGPNLLWVCSGGGQEVLLDATVCEKVAFERQTGMTCVPAGL